MEEKKYYVAVGPFGENRTGYNFEEMKEKVDTFNEPDGPKWYLLEFENREDYMNFQNLRNKEFHNGHVVYDPFNKAQKDIDSRFFREHFVRRFGTRHGDSGAV